MGGRRIDDHSFWAGSKPKNSVFPEGAKMQSHDSDGHAGSLMHYEDNDPAIKKTQEGGTSQIKKRPLKDGNRY